MPWTDVVAGVCGCAVRRLRGLWIPRAATPAPSPSSVVPAVDRSPRGDLGDGADQGVAPLRQVRLADPRDFDQPVDGPTSSLADDVRSSLVVAYHGAPHA
jgi:hypothetical protein